jgi:hypothetical protein
MKEEESHGVLKKAMTYCWSENFLGRFRLFFSENAGIFESHARDNLAASKTEDLSSPTVEHKLSHHQCFSEYLTLFESTLESYVQTQGSSNAEFYSQLSELQSSQAISADEKLFIDCLLASADYDSFYSVMVKEAKKLIIMKDHKARFGLDANGGGAAQMGGSYDDNFDDAGQLRGGAESKDGGGDDDYDDVKGAK